MKLQVLAIGKLKAGPERELVADYVTRTRALARQVGIAAIEVAEGAEASPEQEGRWLLAKIPDKAFVVLLDEKGEARSSADFAKFIRRGTESGADIAFLVGGPNGHDAAVRRRANLTLAFGPQTWPHRLVRVMLLEQIYRAVTILINHPYHRS